MGRFLVHMVFSRFWTSSLLSSFTSPTPGSLYLPIHIKVIALIGEAMA